QFDIQRGVDFAHSPQIQKALDPVAIGDKLARFKDAASLTSRVGFQRICAEQSSAAIGVFDHPQKLFLQFGISVALLIEKCGALRNGQLKDGMEQAINATARL